MAYMPEEITSTTYDVRITIPGDVAVGTATCDYCGENEAVSVLSYITDTGTERETHYRDLCLACVVPVLDSVPYLDEQAPITLEVSRYATARPF